MCFNKCRIGDFVYQIFVDEADVETARLRAVLYKEQKDKPCFGPNLTLDDNLQRVEKSILKLNFATLITFEEARLQDRKFEIYLHVCFKNSLIKKAGNI